MTAGVEALGHGLSTDQRTIEMMAELAATRSKPIRARFGHPGISEQSMGRQIANTGNYRVVGNQLLYDMQLIDAARTSPAFAQDPIEYILRMAAEYPADIATSVVISTGAVWVLPDGTEIDAFGESGDRMRRPEKATSKYPVMRPVYFHYTDLVQEGAVTHDGLFSQKLFNTGASSYAEQLFKLADQWRLAYNIPLDQLPKKLNQLLVAYTHSRTVKGKSSMNMQEEDFSALTDPVEETTPPAANAALANVETALAALAAEEQQQTNPALLDRMAALEEQNARLSAVVEKLTAILLQTRKSLKVLEGEPFANTQVPAHAPVALNRQIPPADLWQDQQPVSTDQRQQRQQPPATSPVSAAMQRQLARQAAGRRQ